MFSLKNEFFPCPKIQSKVLVSGIPDLKTRSLILAERQGRSWCSHCHFLLNYMILRCSLGVELRTICQFSSTGWTGPLNKTIESTVSIPGSVQVGENVFCAVSWTGRDHSTTHSGEQLHVFTVSLTREQLLLVWRLILLWFVHIPWERQW